MNASLSTRSGVSFEYSTKSRITFVVDIDSPLLLLLLLLFLGLSLALFFLSGFVKSIFKCLSVERLSFDETLYSCVRMLSEVVFSTEEIERLWVWLLLCVKYCYNSFLWALCIFLRSWSYFLFCRETVYSKIFTWFSNSAMVFLNAWT